MKEFIVRSVVSSRAFATIRTKDGLSLSKTNAAVQDNRRSTRYKDQRQW